MVSSVDNNFGVFPVKPQPALSENFGELVQLYYKIQLGSIILKVLREFGKSLKVIAERQRQERELHDRIAQVEHYERERALAKMADLQKTLFLNEKL